MSEVGIVGFGALGRQILDLLEVTSKPSRVWLFDDTLHRAQAADSVPFNSLFDDRFAACAFYLGIGYRHLPLKAELADRLLSAGRRLPALVHPSCAIHPSAVVADGCVLFPQANLGARVRLGAGVLVNNSVVVSHDSTVGSAAYLSPGVVLSGRVSVGEAAFLGTGVLVADGRSIGPRARIGVGTVVTDDVGADSSVIGSPMRKLDRPLDLG